MPFIATTPKNAPSTPSVEEEEHSSTSSGTSEGRDYVVIDIESDPEEGLRSEVEQLSTIVQRLENRVSRVEYEKRVETSYIRRFTITGLAYLGATGYLYLLSVNDSYLQAVVPAGVYFLSTIGGFHKIIACWDRCFHSE